MLKLDAIGASLALQTTSLSGPDQSNKLAAGSRLSLPDSVAFTDWLFPNDIRGHDHAPDRHDDAPLQAAPLSRRIIAHAVWLYFQFSLSLRHLADLLAARGVSLQSLSEWAAKFGPELARVLRPI
jgi:hypothetical protein